MKPGPILSSWPDQAWSRAFSMRPYFAHFPAASGRKFTRFQRSHAIAGDRVGREAARQNVNRKTALTIKP
jgi:hypothetical protein